MGKVCSTGYNLLDWDPFVDQFSPRKNKLQVGNKIVAYINVLSRKTWNHVQVFIEGLGMSAEIKAMN